MSKDVMLTTIDNPFNPFVNFDEWLAYDTSHGYNSCQYLARIANISYQLSDEDNDEEIDRAMDRAIELDPFGIYMKTYREEGNKSDEQG